MRTERTRFRMEVAMILQIGGTRTKSERELTRVSSIGDDGERRTKAGTT